MATISNTPRPGYVWDATDNVWYPIGTGTHSHGEIPATIVDAKGDIIAATAADTVARLAVGANDTVLTADSTTATGLKWATPAAGGMTELATGTFSGTSISINSISGSYKQLYLVFNNPYSTTGDSIGVRLNGNTGNVYRGVFGETGGTAWIAPAATSRLDARNFGSTTATQYYTCTYLFENYTSTNGAKPISFMGGYSSQTVFGIFNYDVTATSAITSMTIIATAGTFSGGTYTLYGVK